MRGSAKGGGMTKVPRVDRGRLWVIIIDKRAIRYFTIHNQAGAEKSNISGLSR